MPANEMTVEALLRAHAPHAPESLRTRVFALEPKRAPRRFVLVALPAALALAVAAALVHGIVGSGSKTTNVTERSLGGTVTTQTWSSAGAPSVAGRDSLQSHKVAAVPPTATAQSGYAPSVGSATRLQRTDASIELRVGDDSALAKATTRATQIATSLGG